MSALAAPTSGAAAQPPRRLIPWVVAVVGIVLLACVAGVALLVQLVDESEDWTEQGAEALGDPRTEDLPPSERGLAPSTVPAAVPEANTETEAARGGERFAELTCGFTGRSTLDPPLSMRDLTAAGPHRMALEPGARFDCTDGSDRSTGTVALDADFEDLSAITGVGAGSGRITWEEVAPQERAAAAGATSSGTLVEVELDLPVIVVWTTIVDGPYAGFRGKLVLREWERVTDEDGDVIGVDFARTTTKFSPY